MDERGKLGDRQAFFLKEGRAHDGVRHAAFVFERDKHEALGRARALPANHAAVNPHARKLAQPVVVGSTEAKLMRADFT